MGAGDKYLPVGSIQFFLVFATIDAFPCPRPPEDERTGVAGVMQQLQGTAVFQLSPDKITFAWSFPKPAREKKPFPVKVFYHPQGATCAPVCRKEKGDCLSYLLIGIQLYPLLRIV